MRVNALFCRVLQGTLMCVMLLCAVGVQAKDWRGQVAATDATRDLAVPMRESSWMDMHSKAAPVVVSRQGGAAASGKSYSAQALQAGSAQRVNQAGSAMNGQQYASSVSAQYQAGNLAVGAQGVAQFNIVSVRKGKFRLFRNNSTLAPEEEESKLELTEGGMVKRKLDGAIGDGEDKSDNENGNTSTVEGPLGDGMWVLMLLLLGYVVVRHLRCSGERGTCGAVISD